MQNQSCPDSGTTVRIYIECTHTFFNGGNSGIQRVVRNLANKGRDLSTKSMIISPIVWTGMGFCQPRARVGIKPYFLYRIKNKIRSVFQLSPEGNPGFAKRSLRFLAQLFLPSRLRDGIRHFAKEIPYLLLGLGALPSQFLFGRFISFQKRDIVVLVDSTWRTEAMLDALFAAQVEKRIILGVMLHDLFPLLLPDTCQEITAKGFKSWFAQTIPKADFFVTNSESTRHSLLNYLAEHETLRTEPCISGSFRLGAELDNVEGTSPSDPLQPLWDTPGKAILCVGTIEPRKNHKYLLDTYDIMRNRGENVSLIIVGRVGWKSAATVERIRSHVDFGSRLLHLNNASDHDLAHAIERADCLVCPSYAEGFGLPVVEGMMRGLKVFASDIEVFREIGESQCLYFSLDKPDALANMLTDWFEIIPKSYKLKDLPAFTWPDWKESTQEFVDLTLELAERSQEVSLKFKGQVPF